MYCANVPEACLHQRTRFDLAHALLWAPYRDPVRSGPMNQPVTTRNRHHHLKIGKLFWAAPEGLHVRHGVVPSMDLQATLTTRLIVSMLPPLACCLCRQPPCVPTLTGRLRLRNPTEETRDCLQNIRQTTFCCSNHLTQQTLPHDPWRGTHQSIRRIITGARGHLPRSPWRLLRAGYDCWTGYRTDRCGFDWTRRIEQRPAPPQGTHSRMSDNRI